MSSASLTAAGFGTGLVFTGRLCHPDIWPEESAPRLGEIERQMIQHRPTAS